MIAYRNLRPGEAEAFWTLMKHLDHETKYMLYEPGERTKSPAILARLESVIEDAASGGSFLLAAESNGELVGYISAARGPQKRTAHTAYIVVGIRKAFQNQGIGTQFFRALDAWARQNNLVRLELTVICENAAALHLYQKSGFTIEGTRRKSIYTNDRYLDEYEMSKIYE